MLSILQLAVVINHKYYLIIHYLNALVLSSFVFLVEFPVSPGFTENQALFFQ